MVLFDDLGDTCISGSGGGDSVAVAPNQTLPVLTGALRGGSRRRCYVSVPLPRCKKYEVMSIIVN